MREVRDKKAFFDPLSHYGRKPRLREMKSLKMPRIHRDDCAQKDRLCLSQVDIHYLQSH